MRQADSRIRKTVVNTAAGIANRLCNVFLSFVMRTVFIYTLGIQYTGVSSVFNDILTMLSLSELGIGTAISTSLYKPLKEKNEELIRKLMKFYKDAYRVICLVVVVVGIILLPFLDKIISNVPEITEDIRLIFIFYIVKTASSYLLIYKTTLLIADQKQYVVKGLETYCTVIRYIVEIIVLIICKQFLLYLFIEVAATILQNIIVSRKAEKQYPYAFKRSKDYLSKTEIKNLFKDIKGLAMYQFSASVGNSIDSILISSVISTALVGILSNYTLIRRQLEVLVKQFFTAMIPSVGNLAVEENKNQQYIIFNRLLYISFVITNFCSVSLYILYTPFISTWLGAEYVLQDNIAFIIAFDFFLYILLQVTAAFRTANRLFVKGQYRPLITAILNIILSIILINKYGIFGTIVATVISRLLTQWYDTYLLFKDVFDVPFYKFYIRYWKYIILFISSAFITERVARILMDVTMINSFILKIGCCIVIPNIWVLLWSFRSKEFQYFVELVLQKILKKGGAC